MRAVNWTFLRATVLFIMGKHTTYAAENVTVRLDPSKIFGPVDENEITQIRSLDLLIQEVLSSHHNRPPDKEIRAANLCICSYGAVVPRRGDR